MAFDLALRVAVADVEMRQLRGANRPQPHQVGRRRNAAHVGVRPRGENRAVLAYFQRVAEG